MSKKKGTTAVKEKPAKTIPTPMPKVDEFDHPGGSMVEPFNQQLFESDLITSGRTIIESFTKGVWADEAQLLKACR